MKLDASNIAQYVVTQIPAMIAYWDCEQKCVFSNSPYTEWFGKSPEQMKGITLKELLGPIYEKNLPYILAALKGERQVFERQIPLPSGVARDTITTYTPNAVGGEVQGFTVHVADVTTLRAREAALERTIIDRDAALAEAKLLRGLLPICIQCKDIRGKDGRWQTLESYICGHSHAKFSHGLCTSCAAKFNP